MSDTIDIQNVNLGISQLNDVRDQSIPYGFLRWDSKGSNVVFEKTINIGVIRGFSTVAKTGQYNDLLGAPTLSTVATTGKFSDLSESPVIPKNYDFTFIGLSDTFNTSMPGAFIRWNEQGDQLVYEDAFSVNDIVDFKEQFADLAFTGKYADLIDTPDIGALIANSVPDLSRIKVQSLDGIDFDPTTAPDKSVLVWNAGASTWGAEVQHAGESFIDLNDTYNEAYGPDTLGNKYLRWNTAGDEILYEDNIAATNITGLADVATTGDLNDLINVDYSLTRIQNRSVYSVLVFDKTLSLWRDESSAELGIGGPGGIPIVEQLDDLSDVTINIPRTGETLIYDETDSQWKDGKLNFDDLLNAPSNSTYRLTGLLDTSVNSVRNGYLRWDGVGTTVIYETSIDSSVITGLAPVATSNDYNDLFNKPDIPDVLSDLDDVDTTGLIVGNTLVFNGAFWAPGSIASDLVLDDIQDVDTTDAVSGDVLTYNGVNWTSSASGIASLVGLSDTSSNAEAFGYLRWNSDGTLVNYETTIEASTITGLSPVATTGDFYDLTNNPFSVPPVVSDMDDVDTTGVEEGDHLIYDETSSKWLPQKQTITTEWEIISAETQALPNSNYLTDTVSASVLVVLPENPAANDTVIVGDYLGTYDKNPGFVAPFGSDLIMGLAQTVENNNRNAVVSYTYIDSSIGWKITDGIGEGITRDVTNWFITNTDGTMRVFDSWLIDTSSEIRTVTLPSDPQINDYIEIGDYLGTFDKFECVVKGGINKIMNLGESLTINNRNAIIELTYVDANFGWKITEGVGETGFGGETVMNSKTLYVDVTGSDSNEGTEVAPYATLNKALDTVDKSSIRADALVTIQMNAGIHEYSSSVKVDLAQGNQVEIVGQESTGIPTVITGIQFISGSGGNYSIGFTFDDLVDAEPIQVGDYVMITDTTGDQAEHRILRGLCPVTSVGTGSIVVNNTYPGIIPTLDNVTGNILSQPTIVRFTDSSGLWVPNEVISNISEMALVGNNNVSSVGLTAGWDTTSSFEVGGGRIFSKNNLNITGFSTGIVSNFSGIVTLSNSMINGNGRGVRSSDNATLVMFGSSILSNTNNGIESARSSSIYIDSTDISGNGGSSTNASTVGSVQLNTVEMHLNQTHGIEVLNGGVVQVDNSIISNTNGTTTFLAAGSGQIVIDNNDSGIDAGVAYSPTYGTLDVLNNGTAIIGKFS